MNQSVMQQTRATETERTTVTPLEGELLYTTDEKKLYVGDGSTAGGILVTGAPFITEDMTLNVPADYADINDALDYLANFRISNKAIVTIQVADGTYTYTETILVNHPDAQSIHIIGNETTPSSCKVWNPLSEFIFHVESVTLGRLSGFEIDGSEDSTNFPAGVGVERMGLLIRYSGRVNAGNIETNNCHYGIYVLSGSNLTAEDLKADSNTQSGIRAQLNSLITISNSCSLSNNNQGAYAVSLSTVQAGNSSMSITNNTTGVLCTSNSFVNVSNATVSGNSYKDMVASNGSYIYALSTTYSSSVPTADTIGSQNSYIRTV